VTSISIEEALALSERLKRLYTPAVSDILDDMGYTNQVMDSSLRPIYPDVKIAGPAFTLTISTYASFKRTEHDVEKMARFFQAMYKGCVVVVATHGATHAASWGELMSNAARHRGAVGAVSDGAIRDVPRIWEIKPPFQVFARAFTPADSKGRVYFDEYEVPTYCGGVNVHPGDFVFGDFDGVVVIPREVVHEVVERAEDKVERESGFREAIRRGVDFLSAYQRYRVL
jgi:regulator of RNase E activity RraA